MNKIQSTLSLSAIALVGVVFVMPLVASTANANTTMKLLNCRFDSKSKVEDCCEKIMRTNAKPYWIAGGGGSCGSVIKCVGGGKSSPVAATFVAAVKPKKCFVYIPEVESIGGSDTPDLVRTPTRRSPGKN